MKAALPALAQQEAAARAVLQAKVKVRVLEKLMAVAR